MDVVGHRATAMHVEADAIELLAEEFEIRTAVVINQENFLTIVAPPSNVARLTRSDDPGRARHVDNPPRRPESH